MTARSDHARTGRLVTIGMWACAAIVMVSSARNAAWSFEILGDSPIAGFALGVAVDMALAVALVGDRALHLAGRKSRWGRALRITTCLMSGALNCAVYAWLGQVGIAIFHSFLTVLLILLTEYAQDFTLQTGAIADEHEAAERAEQRTRQAEADEAARLAREQAEAQRAAEDARRKQAAELARKQREHQTRQLAAALAAATLTRRRAKRAAPARAKAPRQDKAPATKPAPNQAPDLEQLVQRARPLVADGMGRTQLARQLDVTPHWARKAIEAIEAEQTPPLHAVERSA